MARIALIANAGRVRARVMTWFPRERDLAELTPDIFLGQLLTRRLEDLRRFSQLDQIAGPAAMREVDRKERRQISDPGCLLHVMGDENDRVLVLQLQHQLLDAARRDRIESGTGFVHHTVGSVAIAWAMHKRCCWPPDSDRPLAFS